MLLLTHTPFLFSLFLWFSWLSFVFFLINYPPIPPHTHITIVFFLSFFSSACLFFTGTTILYEPMMRLLHPSVVWIVSWFEAPQLRLYDEAVKLDTPIVGPCISKIQSEPLLRNDSPIWAQIHKVKTHSRKGFRILTNRYCSKEAGTLHKIDRWRSGILREGVWTCAI